MVRDLSTLRADANPPEPLATSGRQVATAVAGAGFCRRFVHDRSVGLLFLVVSFAVATTVVAILRRDKTGWAQLAARHAVAEISEGTELPVDELTVGQSTYRGPALRVLATSAGLALVPHAAFRRRHPPLLLPWTVLASLPIPAGARQAEVHVFDVGVTLRMPLVALAALERVRNERLPPARRGRLPPVPAV